MELDEVDMQTHLRGISLKNPQPTPDLRDVTTGANFVNGAGSVPQQVAFLQQVPQIQASALPPIWQVLARQYELANGPMGEGAFGQVVRGRCRQSNTEVAIKLVENYNKSEYTCLKVVRELLLLKELEMNHVEFYFSPSLIDVYLATPEEKMMLLQPLEQTKEFIFIIMEPEAEDLKSFLEKKAVRMSEQMVVIILYQILCSLKFFHSSNVIHRDLKPANILINPSTIQVRICDFGNSRTLPESMLGKGSGNTKRVRDNIVDQGYIVTADNMDVTKSIVREKIKQINESIKKKPRCLSAHVGSRWYRSPENCVHMPQYDYASDMWSLGCIMYELLIQIPRPDGSMLQESPVLFPGDSCYPSSPMTLLDKDNMQQVTVSTKDQLRLIVKKLQPDVEEDFCFVDSENTMAHLLQYKQQDKGERIDFKQMFAHLNPELVNLLEQLLQFNPFYRPSARECLKHSIFNSCRLKGIEKSAKKKHILFVDEDNVFDYETGQARFSIQDYLGIISNIGQEIHTRRLMKLANPDQTPAQNMQD